MTDNSNLCQGSYRMFDGGCFSLETLVRNKLFLRYLKEILLKFSEQLF